MTNGDCAALGVNLGLVNSQLARAVQCLGSEGFVDLPNTHVSGVHADLLEQLGDCNGRANAHLVGGAAGNRAGDPASLDGR